MKQKLSNLLSLKNKTVLIIGGGGWLGKPIVEVALELGANVIVAGFSNKKKISNSKIWLNRLIKTKKLKYFETDVTNKKSLKKLQNIIAKEKSLDVLVNCFWKGKKSDWEKSNFKSWSYDININLNATYSVCKLFYKFLIASKGTILNISSMYSIVAPAAKMYKDVPQTNPPGYGSAKAGINQLSRYLASFLGEQGVTVNCLSPGAFPFPSIQQEYPDFAQRLIDNTMIKRIGDPNDLKGLVAVLISDAGKYITGQNISIDGGWTSW